MFGWELIHQDYIDVLKIGTLLLVKAYSYIKRKIEFPEPFLMTSLLSRNSACCVAHSVLDIRRLMFPRLSRPSEGENEGNIMCPPLSRTHIRHHRPDTQKNCSNCNFLHSLYSLLRYFSRNSTLELLIFMSSKVNLANTSSSLSLSMATILA